MILLRKITDHILLEILDTSIKSKKSISVNLNAWIGREFSSMIFEKNSMKLLNTNLEMVIIILIWKIFNQK